MPSSVKISTRQKRFAFVASTQRLEGKSKCSTRDTLSLLAKDGLIFSGTFIRIGAESEVDTSGDTGRTLPARYQNLLTRLGRQYKFKN